LAIGFGAQFGALAGCGGSSGNSVTATPGRYTRRTLDVIAQSIEDSA
jgi:hypothetical protein